MTEVSKMGGLTRFGFLKSDQACSKPIYDEILFECDGCVVTPTAGSIVPNWLLIVPRSPVINFSRWSLATNRSPLDLVEKVVKNCGSIGSFVWFEHGPAQAGSSVGCGVDQAHLHVIFDTLFTAQQLQTEAIENSSLDWSVRSADAIYPSLSSEKSYLAVGSLDTAAYAQGVEQVGSQFFRRMIARLSHQTEAWNYRTHPHTKNVEKTIRNYKAAREIHV